MNTNEHLEAALVDLRAKRARVDDAIRAIEELLGVAPVLVETTAPRQERRGKSANGAAGAASSSFADAVVACLKVHGEMAPRALAKKMRLSIAQLRYQIKPLEQAGRVVITGATLNRRVVLPGKAPAKEAP